MGDIRDSLLEVLLRRLRYSNPNDSDYGREVSMLLDRLGNDVEVGVDMDIKEEPPHTA